MSTDFQNPRASARGAVKDRLCTPEEANAFHPPPRNRSASLKWAAVCAISLISAAVLIGKPF